MTTIDEKIKTVYDISGSFPFIEYYSHGSKEMYKIDNPFTKYKKETQVLCSLEDGFEKALDLAIEFFNSYL